MARHDIILMSLLILPTILFLYIVIAELRRLFETRRMVIDTISGFDKMLDSRKTKIAQMKESYNNLDSEEMREFMLRAVSERLNNDTPSI